AIEKLSRAPPFARRPRDERVLGGSCYVRRTGYRRESYVAIRARVGGVETRLIERQRGANHRRDGDERVLGSSGPERFRSQRREAVDLDCALPRVGRFRLRAIEQLRRQHGGREERQHYEPVERILDRERSERRQKEVVEAEKGDQRQGETERPSPAGA